MQDIEDAFVGEGYAERVCDAAGTRPEAFARAAERELLTAYSLEGRSLGVSIPSGAAHRLGIAHRTSDVLLQSPDGHVILRQRSKDDPMFPGQFSFSAGGHSIDGELPRVTAARELEEETGLKISSLSRFIPLHESRGGLPLFYREWRSDTGTPNAALSWQFSKREGLLTRAQTLPAIQWPEGLVKWKSLLGGNGDLALLNQEFTFYFLVKLAQSEVKELLSRSSESAPYCLMCPRQVLLLSGNPQLTTDGFRCLFSATRRRARFLHLSTPQASTSPVLTL